MGQEFKGSLEVGPLKITLGDQEGELTIEQRLEKLESEFSELKHAFVDLLAKVDKKTTQ